MTSVLRATRSLLLLSSITLWACSDQMAIHQLVLAEGETEGAGFCATLSDGLSGGNFTTCDSDDDYRQQFVMGGGQAKFSFLISRDLGDDTQKQVGGPGPSFGSPDRCVLVLDIDIDQDHFAHGARLDHFATRAGVEHAVYTWAEADCELPEQRSVPQWVLDKVAAP
jgi:hypothetical protein